MLNKNERAAFFAVADILIPAYGKMAAFSQVDSQGRLTDRVLELRPELLAELKAVLAQVDSTGDASTNAERLYRERPEAIGLVGLIASSAYYLDPEVRRRLGYPGQLQRPPTDDEEYDYEDLLQPVKDRGAIFRPTKA